MKKTYNKWIQRARESKLINNSALLLLGDSEEILKDTDIRADSVITDPPYDFDSRGGPKLFNRKKKSAFCEMRDLGLSQGFNPEILKWAALADSMMVFCHNDQFFDLLKWLTQPREIYKTHPSPFRDGELQASLIEPLYQRNVICAWHKTNPMPVANKHYVPDTEFYIHAWRSPFFPQGDLMDKGRYILGPVGKSDVDHPTVKPQHIMRKCVLNGSKPGDVILDPFCGSGSTGVAALQLGRRFIGIEKEEKFYKLAASRLAGAAGVWLPDCEPGLFNQGVENVPKA